VSLWTSYPESNGRTDIFSPPNYIDMAARTKTLAAVGGYDDINFALAGSSGEPQSFPGERMTASMGQVLGIAPQMGRWFTQEEDERGDALALVSDAIWRNRLGGDPQVLGHKLTMNGRDFVIIGVLPPRIGFPSMATQIYIPMNFTAKE